MKKSAVNVCPRPASGRSSGARLSLLSVFLPPRMNIMKEYIRPRRRMMPKMPCVGPARAPAAGAWPSAGARCTVPSAAGMTPGSEAAATLSVRGDRRRRGAAAGKEASEEALDLGEGDAVLPKALLQAEKRKMSFRCVR